jgi:membrane protease YdiL (CAAX protease family)
MRAYKSIVFLALTFAISWTIAIAGHFAGWPQAISAWLGAPGAPLGAAAVLFAMMTGPALAGVACALAFERGRRIKALGLHFRPNWWWLGAWLLGLALAGVAVAATLLLSDRTLVAPLTGLRALLGSMGQDTSQFGTPPAYMNYVLIVQAAVLGAAINAVLTLTEELGWRGYLHYLWRGAGFWRASLATGAIWGVWHAPAIVLYGHNYPEHPEIGVALFTLFCVLLAPLHTFVRDRGASVWAAGILHGTLNALGGVTLIVLSDPAFPWNGMVGIGGFVALALALAIVAATRPGAPASAA